MRRLFMVVVAVLTVTVVSAQGFWMGGKLGYWHDKDGNEKMNSLSISPEVGYDFNSKWSVGLALGVDYQEYKIGDNSSVNKTIVTIDPYARYKYYNKGILTLFVDGGFGFAFADADGFKIGLTPGMSLKITDNFSFLTTVGFLGYAQDYYNSNDGKGFGLNFSSYNMKFGFYYSF